MKKWQVLTLGILIGLLISGVVFALMNRVRTPEFSYISPTLSLAANNSINYTIQGKININEATLADLDTLPGIGPEKAKAIIDFREKNGKFASLDDLLYVPGIGQALLDQIKDKITVQ
jgi:competence protein ComEA